MKSSQFGWRACVAIFAILTYIPAPVFAHDGSPKAGASAGHYETFLSALLCGTARDRVQTVAESEIMGAVNEILFNQTRVQAVREATIQETSRHDLLEAKSKLESELRGSMRWSSDSAKSAESFARQEAARGAFPKNVIGENKEFVVSIKRLVSTDSEIALDVLIGNRLVRFQIDPSGQRLAVDLIQGNDREPLCSLAMN